MTSRPFTVCPDTKGYPTARQLVEIGSAQLFYKTRPAPLPRGQQDGGLLSLLQALVAPFLRVCVHVIGWHPLCEIHTVNKPRYVGVAGYRMDVREGDTCVKKAFRRSKFLEVAACVVPYLCVCMCLCHTCQDLYACQVSTQVSSSCLPCNCYKRSLCGTSAELSFEVCMLCAAKETMSWVAKSTPLFLILFRTSCDQHGQRFVSAL